MGWVKTVSIVFIVLLITIVVASISAIFFRNELAQQVANHYLSELAVEQETISYIKGGDITLDCLDFSVNSAWDLTIHQACVKHQLGSAKIHRLTLVWAMSPNFTIKAVQADDIELTGTAALPVLPSTSTQDEPPFTPAALHQLIADFISKPLPVHFKVNHFSYQPFTVNSSDHSDGNGNEQPQQKYQGQIAITPRQLAFSIGQRQEFFSAELTTQPKTLKGQITLDFTPMRDFLTSHGITLAKALDDKLTMKGKLSSQFAWSAQQLKLFSELKSPSFHHSAIQANLHSDVFTWQTSLIQNVLTLNFDDKDLLTVDISDQTIIDWLTAQQATPHLVTLLKDNPALGFTVRPRGHWQFDFDKQQLNLTKLNIINHNMLSPLSLALDNIAVSLNHGSIEAKTEYALQLKARVAPLQSLSDNNADDAGSIDSEPADITITGQITRAVFSDDELQVNAEFDAAIETDIAPLQAYSTEPVSIKLNGKVAKTNQDLQLHFEPSSQVALGALSLSQPVEVRASAGLINFGGDVLLSQSANDPTIAPTITLNLAIQSQFDQLNAWTLAQPNEKGKALSKIARVKTNTTIEGSINNVLINGDITADDMLLATFSLDGNFSDNLNVNVNGATHRPRLKVNATDISLLDLWASGLSLSLRDKLTAELIDGAIDYELSGELIELTDLAQNDLKLSLTLRDVTGKVNDFWLQDLNWQQHFNYSDGDVTTDARQNNFSLALAEVGTDITNLSAKTNIDFIQQTFSVTLNNVSGEAFGGGFSAATVQWPFISQEPVVMQLDSIDLAQLIALEQQQGITVTGKISGELPLSLAESTVTIANGELHNVTEGKIQIMNNPAVARLKESRTELKLAFDALQNLHYHQLTSLVTMTKDGQMLLETAIKGINPDLDNEVNFNLDLDYDLIGLIESLRIADSFENQINEKTQNQNQN